MAQVHQQSVVNITPKDGELAIKLDITINFTSDGLSVMTVASEDENTKCVPIVPNFGSGKTLDFGKSIKEK